MRPVFARLVDPTQHLPWPSQPGRLFSPEGEMVDADEPFFVGCFADGSLIEAEPEPVLPEDPARESDTSKTEA